MRITALLSTLGLASTALGHGYLTIPKSRTRLGAEVSKKDKLRLTYLDD